MAELVASFCCSHAPTLARLMNERDKSQEGIVSIYQDLGSRVRSYDTDFLILIYNDHIDNFFLDAFPTFALGVGEVHDIADEGKGGYWDGKLRGASQEAMHVLQCLVRDNFDLTVSYGEMALDHGAIVPLLMADLVGLPIIPLSVNCVIPPVPSASRCWDLGTAIRRSIETMEQDARCVVIATGGLSHQLSGPAFGNISKKFDREILEKIVGKQRESISDLTREDLLKGGEGGLEVLNWVVAAGVAGEDFKGETLTYDATSALMTGLAVIEMKAH